MIGEGLARWASPALKRVVFVFPRCIPSSPGPSSGPSPSKPKQELESRVAQTEAARMATRCPPPGRVPGKGKVEVEQMVREHKGLEVRHVFYFYFFPTSCLSEVSHGLPPVIGTIASPLLRRC